MLTSPFESVRRLFDLNVHDNLPPRYNIAPTQPVAVVRAGEAHTGEDTGAWQLTPMRWGLVPDWMKEIPTERPMINARSETVAHKPSFRAAYRHRRCLVPANGWYEWIRVAGAKQPVWIGLEDQAPFAFAGIWERWTGPDGGDWLETVAILTEAATGPLGKLHHRKPIVLAPEDHDRWIGPADPPPKDLIASLTRRPEQAFTHYMVSTRVNNVRFDDPDCLKPDRPVQGTLL